MHPLSIFPGLFTYALIAPLLLRLAVGLYIIYLGKNRYKKTFGPASLIYILAGIFLVLGFYTQIVALIGVIVLIFDFFVDKEKTDISQEKSALYILAGIIFLSLLFTGPGFLALDLPL